MASKFKIWSKGKNRMVELGPEFRPREVRFPGFKRFRFFSHKQFNGDPSHVFWVVTEARTGLKLEKDDTHITRRQAEAGALAVLTKQGLNGLRRAMQAHPPGKARRGGEFQG